MKPYQLVLMAALGGCAAPTLSAFADTEPPKATSQEKLHNELRAFRDKLTDAVLKGDVDRQMALVHKDVVVTWQNGEVCRGHKGLEEFLRKNAAGQSKIFQGYTVPPTPEDLTILHGATGISYGTSVARYKLVGKEFELKNYWTATLLREDGKWLLTSYHVSGNLLDNPLLNAAKSSLYWMAGISLVVGLLVGLLLGRTVRRTRVQTSGPGPV